MHDPTHTPCIVVADDDSFARGQVARALQMRGFEVLEAADAGAALQLAASRPIDVVVTDLQTPRMRGEEMGRWMAEIGPDIPVVFMTAYPSYEQAVAAVRCRAAGFLEKPFRSMDDVVHAVESALEQRDRPAVRKGRSDDDEDRVESLKRRFVSGVAHELRTPITVIRSLVSVLAKGVHGPLTTEQKEILRHVLAETEAFAHEIDKLLSLARVEDEDFVPDLRACSADDIIAPLVRPLGARANERKVELHFDVPDRNAAVMADAQDITRALHALGENALKFTAEGGHVVIRALPTDDGLRFEVQDTGIGIDPADHGRVFECFTQLDNLLAQEQGGCGIGLTFAAGVVAAHGSRIRIASRIGEGATFSFVLPWAPEAMTESCTSDLRAKGGARA
ncbi:MAG: Adaptive-response sensory-kinase SasA [Planctomycetes bacterium]|nr:Adaptive-response sensory-kinase SasA [Planctomycetota bacterium]